MGIEGLFTTKVEVYHLNRVSDGQGGWEEDYVFYANIWGRISSPSTGERQLALTEAVNVTHMFYCNAGAQISAGDEIRRGDKKYKVLSVMNPSEANHHLEVRLEATQE